MVERRSFAVDAAVVAFVALAVLVAVSIGTVGAIGAAATVCFLAVVAGAVFAPSYRRALTRAFLASLVAIFALLGFSPAELTDNWFRDDEGLSVGALELLPVLAAFTLVPATLSALVAHALASAWRVRAPM